MINALRMVDTAPQFRVQRAEGTRRRAADERVEIVDLAGETVLSLTVGGLYALASRLIEMGLEIADDHHTIQGMLSEPAVTAADLAAVYEMGRRAGRRPARPQSGARRS